MNINDEILDYPERSFNFFKNNLNLLSESERLKLCKIIFKSEFLSFSMLDLTLTTLEKDLLIDKVINEQKYLLVRCISKVNLNEHQLDKIESLLILGQIAGDYMEEDLKYIIE